MRSTASCCEVKWAFIPSEDVFVDQRTPSRILAVPGGSRSIRIPSELRRHVEQYNELADEGRYDAAYRLFMVLVNYPTLHLLNAARLRIRLLRRLFPNGIDAAPALTSPFDQAMALNALAQGLQFGGRPVRAIPLFRRSVALLDESGNRVYLEAALDNLSLALYQIGALREAHNSAKRAEEIDVASGDRIALAHARLYLGKVQAAIGASHNGRKHLEESLQVFEAGGLAIKQALAVLSLGALALWEKTDAGPFADRAMALLEQARNKGGQVDSRRYAEAVALTGLAELQAGRLENAQSHLRVALDAAREVGFVQGELPAAIGLAEICRIRRRWTVARRFLGEVIRAAKTGGYALLSADAFNSLAQLEADWGRKRAAVDAAQRAFRLAWCDGPPFIYHWGLRIAQGLLERLSAPLPVGPGGPPL